MSLSRARSQRGFALFGVVIELLPAAIGNAQESDALSLTLGPRDRGFERVFNPFRGDALWPESTSR